MKRQTETRAIEIAGHYVDVTIRRAPRAHRISLRMDPRPGALTLVTPSHINTPTALGFVHENSAWIADRLSRQKPAIRFCHGAEIPFRGRPHIIESRAGNRGVVESGDGTISVPGRPEHLPRRLTDWLKNTARNTLAEAATKHAAAFERMPGRISVRDQKTRWGSCSAMGNLSFSWRLILAPPDVLDYVAAHEAAHLVEMNHSAAFWKLVRGRIGEPAPANQWLRDYGAGLHRFGAAPD